MGAAEIALALACLGGHFRAEFVGVDQDRFQIRISGFDEVGTKIEPHRSFPATGVHVLGVRMFLAAPCQSLQLFVVFAREIRMNLRPHRRDHVDVELATDSLAGIFDSPDVAGTRMGR